jgi:hypothetical protein
MRWLVRIFLLLTMIGLAWLAIWPHLPRLEKEAHHLYETWQSLRNPEPGPNTTTIRKNRDSNCRA